jgi:tight adherence protein C
LPYLKKLQTQADILKINLDIQVLVVIKAILGILVGILVFVFTKVPSYGLAGGFLGFFIPDFMFMSKVKAKKEAIVRVFPETIDLIDLCIGAGLDFPSSIKWVIDKSVPNPFMEQLAIVLSEIQIGRNRIDALRDMAKRLNLRDISSFVRTVIQSERMGTSVESGFRNLSEDTRNMRFQDGERYAIKASLKILFPLLFCILPVIMIVVAGPIIIKFTQGELLPKAGVGF